MTIEYLARIVRNNIVLESKKISRETLQRVQENIRHIPDADLLHYNLMVKIKLKEGVS